MSQKTRTASTGEMRRRHEAIIRSGSLAKLRSEGRLVFALALCWADYKNCQFRMSARGAATVAGVQPTAIRRGLRQLVDQGVIEVGPSQPRKRQLYRFLSPESTRPESTDGRAQGVCAPRAHSVRAPDTHGARGAHERCADRAQGVSGARTGCAPYSSIVLKGSSRTREDSGRSGPVGPAVQSEQASQQQEGAA